MNYSEAKQILDKQEKAKAVLEGYKKLETAHEQFGFKTRQAFVKALKEIDLASRKTGGRGKRGLSPDTIDQIHRMKADGKSNAEISRTLGVSPLTVGKYVKAVAGKSKAAKPRAAKPRATKARATRGRGKKA